MPIQRDIAQCLIGAISTMPIYSLGFSLASFLAIRGWAVGPGLNSESGTTMTPTGFEVL
jgi:hypothetical protein